MRGTRAFKITKRTLDALGPKDGTASGTKIPDAELTGFYVNVYATGEISFFIRYRVNGQRRTVRLGRYPGVTPEAARKEALAIIGAAARGVDESEKRKAARENATALSKRITFGDWRKEYLVDAARRRKTTRDLERYLAMAGEEWDARPLAEISTRDVEAYRNRLASRGATQANRWTTDLHASFAQAVRLGHVERNVVSNMKRLPENEPRQRVLSTDEEKRLREAIASWPNKWERTAFTLLVDCGARLSEVLKAKWEDFTLDEKTHAGTWRIPSPKSGKPQAIPILAHVGKVVAATPRLDDAPFVVVGRVGTIPRHDLRKTWDRLRAAAKVPADVHIHDLRRSFGLRATLSVGIFGASKLLRHANTGVTERVYAPIAPEQMRGYAEGVEAARILAFKKKASKKSA